MLAEPTITDPRHRRSLPSGARLAAAVRALLRRQRQAALTELRRGRVPSLAGWQGAMVEAVLPYFRTYYLDGMRRAAGRKSLGAIRERSGSDTGGRAYVLRKALEFSWDVVNEQVEQAIREATFAFVAHLNDSTEDMLREALQAALVEGESARELQRRLDGVFGQPRAFTVAQTESSRMVHAGQVRQAQQSGVAVGLTWLASADACDLCLGLDGKTVRPGEPFHVHETGNPAYRLVTAPPAHPHCMCSLTEEIGDPRAIR